MDRDKTLVQRGFRYLADFARDEPLVFGAAFFGAVIFAAGAVGATVALGVLVDDVVIPLVEDRADNVRTAQVLVIVGVIAVARAVGVVGRRFFAGMLQARTKATLQRRAIHRLLLAPLQHVRTTPTGRLLAHVDSDADAATEPLAPLPFSIGAVVIIILAIASLLLIDVWLALVGVVLIPMLLVLQRVHSHFIAEPAIEVRKRLGTVASIAHESFDGALVVKTLGRERNEVERFEAATAHHRDARIRQSKIRIIYDEGLEMLPSAGVLVLILVAVWRVDAGAITTGEFVQAVAVFGILGFPIAVAGYFFATLPIGTVARDRLDDVFELAADPLLAPEARRSLPRGHLGVELEDVSIVVDNTVLVDHVSLRIEPGSTVALVGATGSGKSTILRAMARLIELDSGHVSVGGCDLGAIDEASLRLRVGVALQEPFLFGDTIQRNLRLGIDEETTGSEVVDDALRVAAADFVEAMPDGIETVVGERGVTLSGGQRQRVALARAMVRRPGLLLADDATSAVDPVVEQRILERLRALDTTVVVVAHRMSTIALADRVVFVSGGRIAGRGTHDELLADPEYLALVRAYETAEAK